MMRFVILMIALPLFAFQQSASSSMASITRAMSSGNATAVGTHFDDNVELSLPSEDGIYGKAKAVEKLNQFFGQHTIKGFSQVHEGSSKGNAAKYCIGNLQTDKGNFRVYMFVEVDQNRYSLQELRIE
ncbi:MAG: DUF4783 domain-containing protein [Bacteroidota bacterium]